MPSFGTRSIRRLNTCDPRLQEIFNEVIEFIDCSILEGKRGKERQEDLFASNRSKVRWPDSKHNVPCVKCKGYGTWRHHGKDVECSDCNGTGENPNGMSRAVDVAPYPIMWEGDIALKRFHVFAGYVIATAEQMGHKLIWGGDWDGDWQYDDQRFHDFPHFQLVED